MNALRHRDFRVLWIATSISNAGSWMQKVATSWLVYRMTGSELWLGIDAFASGFTTVVLLPFGGALSDRFDRRRLLIWTNTICALLALGLAALAWLDVLHVWHIVLFSGLNGVVLAVLVPASTSLLPAIVGESDVPNAIALNSLQFNLSRVVGPVVGGATLVYFGAGWSFALNAASFVVLAAALLYIRNVPSVPRDKLPLGGSLLDGLRFVKSRADLFILLLLVGATALLSAPVVSLLPAVVKQIFARDAASYSFLVSCFGAGAVLAALLTALIADRLPKTWVVPVALATLGACQASLVLTAWRAAVVLVAIAGLALIGAMIRLGTTILQNTPDEFRGRVTSLQQVCFRAGQPLGALIAGAIGLRWGVRGCFCAFGAMLIAVALLGLSRQMLANRARENRSRML